MHTNHPTSQPPDTTPAAPVVVEDRFRAIVDAIATEAREATALRDGLDSEITAELAADRADEERQAELERELAELSARRTERARQLADRTRRRQEAAATVVRLESDARRGLAAIEHLNRYRDAEPLPPEEAVRTAVPPVNGRGPVLPPGVVSFDGTSAEQDGGRS